MQVISPQEKAKLIRILTNISLLQTAEDRRNFLSLCGLDNYCSLVNLDTTLDKFIISLLSKLFKPSVSNKDSKELELVILLEHINQFQLNLSSEDNQFISYVISKWEEIADTDKQSESFVNYSFLNSKVETRFLDVGKNAEPNLIKSQDDNIDSLIQQARLLQVAPKNIEIVNHDSENIPTIIREKQSIEIENINHPPDKHREIKYSEKVRLLAEYTKSNIQPIEKFLKGEPIDCNVFFDICSKLKLNLWQIMDIDFLKVLVLVVPQVRSQHYAKIQNQCGTIQILDVARAIDLDDLYVDVNILKEPSSYTRLEPADLPLVYNPKTDEFDRFCLGKVCQARVPGLEVILSYSKLMVLGKPGSGKSTLLQHIAIRCNRGQLQPDRVPIFIRLKTFAEDSRDKGDFSLLHYINQELEDCGIADSLVTEAILLQGRVLILLDGLDEVPESDGDEVVKQIRRFSEKYYRNQFIITCRIAAKQYRFSGFTYIEVADFNQEQIEDFAKKWFGAVAKNSENEGKEKASQFIEKLSSRENQQIRELAVTPILLNLTCLVFQAKADFPSNRARLYEEGLEILLRKWDESRGIKRDKAYRKLSLGNRIELLSQIASITFSKNHYFFEESEVKRCIEDYLLTLPNAPKIRTPSLKQDAKAVLKSIEAQHGLLVERAQQIYSFSHLTFQEYFTAKAIIASFDPKDSEKVFSNITKKSWREVFLLSVGMMQEADELVQLVKQKIDHLLASDKKLQQFLKWLNQKSQLVKAPCKIGAVRAFYFAISLDNDHALDLAFNLDRRLAYMLDRFPDLDCDFAVTQILNLALDFEYYFIHTFENNSDEEFTDNSDEEFANNFEPLKLFDELTEALNCILGRDTAPELIQDLEQLQDQLPNSKNVKKVQEWLENNIQIWTMKLRELIINHRNICYDWKFTAQQKKMLEQYYNANKLLMDCLNSGCELTLAVRQGIESTLLLPYKHNYESLIG